MVARVNTVAFQGIEVRDIDVRFFNKALVFRIVEYVKRELVI